MNAPITALSSPWGALAVSLASASLTLWIVVGWMRRCGMRVSWWAAFVLLLTTWGFARAVWLGAFFDGTAPKALIATLCATLALRNFFYVYKSTSAVCHSGRRGDLNASENEIATSPCGLLAMTHNSRALTPVWLFGALVFGGAAGLAAPVGAMAAFLIVERQWRHTGKWFGVREVLIICTLCVAGLVAYVAGARSGGSVGGAIADVLSTPLHPATHEHLFWYPTRLLVGLLPWAPLHIFVIVRALVRGKIKSDMARFCLHTTWSMLLAISLISSKSTLYLLPIYPFVACLTAALLTKRR